jgi:hypothetical protein
MKQENGRLVKFFFIKNLYKVHFFSCKVEF